jgi:hypothetical protein
MVGELIYLLECPNEESKSKGKENSKESSKESC